MDYLLLSCTSAVLFFLAFLSGETSSINMCRNRTMNINDDNFELDAFGSPPSPLATNTSITCSCYMNMTGSSNKVTVKFSRETNLGFGCIENKYDSATLIWRSGSTNETLTLQNNSLSSYYGEYKDLSTMTLSLTINSICDSHYTIQLEQTTWWPPKVKFQQVTCSYSKTVVSSSSTTAPPNVMKPEGVTTNYMSSIYLGQENSSADSVFKNSTPAPVPIDLIVGVVVGVGGGLLIIVAIVSVVFIFRRRRAIAKPLTYANYNAPTEPHASVSYEGPSDPTQLQTGVLYDNQSAATDPLATESDHAYYNVQGIDNSAFHHSVAVPNNGQISAEELYYSAVQEPHSVNDTDTTVVENDLYEKNNMDTMVIENELYEK